MKNIETDIEKLRKKNPESKFKDDQILIALNNILDGLGIDLTDPNYIDTPFRILKSYYEIFEGMYNDDEINNILSTRFPSDYDGMVVVDNITCFSMCPHHFLPVEYRVDFGYIPKDNVLGISKLARLVKHLAKQPILQEDFTSKIIHHIINSLKPKGAIVYVRGRHMCMSMRGIEQPDAWTLTSKLHGNFYEEDVKSEFLSLLKTRS